MHKIMFLGIGKEVEYENFKSSMVKISQNEIMVNFDGVKNDSISDKKSHGGIKKAMFANSAQNYEIWRDFLQKDIKFGEMGENIIIENLHESNVMIGDIHKIGGVIAQVFQPRKPCAKLSKIFNNKNFTMEIFRSGLSGWYYKILQPGVIKLGDKFEILQRDGLNLSVLDVNKAFYDPMNNLEIFDKIKQSKTINKSWIDTIDKRINKTYDDRFMREIL